MIGCKTALLQGVPWYCALSVLLAAVFSFYPYLCILFIIEYYAPRAAQLACTFLTVGHTLKLTSDAGVFARNKVGIIDKFQACHAAVSLKHLVLIFAFRHSYYHYQVGRAQTILENVLCQYNELALLVGYHGFDGLLLRMLLLEAEILQVEV